MNLIVADDAKGTTRRTLANSRFIAQIGRNAGEFPAAPGMTLAVGLYETMVTSHSVAEA